MPQPPRICAIATASFGALALLAGPVAAGAATAASRPADLTLTGKPSVTSTVTAPKARTSRAAKSDPALLALTGSAPRAVLVKLDYDSLATYEGDATGLGATSPSVTGRKLDRTTTESRAQEARIDAVEQGFRAALTRAIPGATVGRSLRVVYGGLALRLPADQIKALPALPGVVAVQDDTLNHPLAVSDEAAFIGAPTVYADLGSARTAGAGVLIADLDSGVWPEHPSFAARSDLPAKPRRPDGSAYPCAFGDNPLTPAADPFTCNNKLVTGQAFLDTYDAVVGDELYKGTARDDDGHGTHTTSTAGGNPLAHAELFGVDRGPVQGIAPGAQVAEYRVCGPTAGCFSSDSTAAVEQAVLDGADVLNFSISGGTDPFADPVELAFLDAYAAGVFVSASAGNDGPTAGTANHLSPWVTSVAASTQSRAFVSTLTVSAGGASVVVEGASIMGGLGEKPVVRAESVRGEDPLCLTPARPGSFSGKIVICQRGDNARVEKGFNVAKGGAAGMILENTVVQDLETDNHFLPAIHLDAPQSAKVDAFVKAHPSATASFTPGRRDQGHGDVMAAFSSRGPAGDFLKPDVTSTGVQVLAGNTPRPRPDPTLVPGTSFQAIAGTSMAAPHVTGSAALLKAEHPSWTPGQIKSALATTALQKVVKEDGTTPADPFDDGSGRVDLTKAGDPGLTFDAAARSMVTLGDNPARQVDLNLPSIYVPTMPGELTTFRTARNVTARPLTFDVSTRATDGARITVTPSHFTVAPGATVQLKVKIDGSSVAVGRTVFGQVDLASGSVHRLHLPAVFTRAQTDLTLSTTCAASTVPAGDTTTCAVAAQNNSLEAAAVTTVTRGTDNVTITKATGPAEIGGERARASARLAPRRPGRPQVSDGQGPAGFLDLAGFGIAPTAIGDETAQNYTVPTFVYHGQTYNSLGVTSNGYLVVGGATTSADVTIHPQQMPDPAAPNNVLAPFWSDVDGTGDEGIRVGLLGDGTRTWLVVQADEHVFGTRKQVHYQVWIGINGTEDISYAYDPARPITPEPRTPFAVGAENAEGTAGEVYPGLPPGDVVVHSTPGAPGGVLRYTVTVRADRHPAGSNAQVITELQSPSVRGVTVASDRFRIGS